MSILEELIDFELSCFLLEVRTNFNLDQFEKLPNWQDKMNYATQNLKELGRGSSRAAFLLSNRYVLKMALPEAGAKGIGQNKGEVTVWSNPEIKPYVAAVYKNDPKFEWIISEIARPMTSEKEIEQYAKISWNVFDLLVQAQTKWQEVSSGLIEERQAAIQKLQARLNTAQDEQSKKALTDKIQNLTNVVNKINATINSEIFKGAIALVTKANVSAGDVREWSHWAKSADGRLIIIDYGFTKDLQDLYKPKQVA